jgi:quinol monooxygenase YgiN
MPYVIAATYVAKQGEADGVKSVLEEMTPLTRGEPGCLTYQAHRSVENENVFFLYESYRDEEAFAAHVAADYFERLIKGEAWPRLARREVVRAVPLDDAE